MANTIRKQTKRNMRMPMLRTYCMSTDALMAPFLRSSSRMRLMAFPEVLAGDATDASSGAAWVTALPSPWPASSNNVRRGPTSSTSLEGAPCCATEQSAIMHTSSKSWINDNWFSAIKTAQPEAFRARTLRRMLVATTRSTAAKGSSSTKSAGAVVYNARAMATRCCCPPDNVTPRSPISVSSPSGMFARSFSKHAPQVAAERRVTSLLRPKRMLSAMVPAMIRGFCGTYAIRRLGATAVLPEIEIMSPRTAMSKELLPAPTRPRTPRLRPSSKRR
mmetsp:Transcript_34949/g.96609  ORF Transcript_34949/g.96609 Transcript_34949/m.96609 type:complete len:276 (-) Transcript_34949:1383-2210(-)